MLFWFWFDIQPSFLFKILSISNKTIVKQHNCLVTSNKVQELAILKNLVQTVAVKSEPPFLTQELFCSKTLSLCCNRGIHLSVYLSLFYRRHNYEETFTIHTYFLIGPSYPPSQASPLSLAMWGTAFLVEWLSPGH